MNESPYNNIRETAFYFVEQQVEPNEQFHSKECSRVFSTISAILKKMEEIPFNAFISETELQELRRVGGLD